MKLLVDEDISPKTAKYLEKLGHNVKEVRKVGKGFSDSKVVDLARRENRYIITQDKDFGEIYYFSENKELKIVVLKPSRQKISLVNRILESNLHSIQDEENGLFILREDKVRKLK